MLVSLGPVPSTSVRSWVADARKVLASMASDPVEPGEEGVWLPPDVLANFSAYLDTWESTAGEDEVFRWDGEIAADQAEYLMHAFFRLAHHLNETVQERGYRFMTPDGDAFYANLVTSMVEALEQEGASSSEFSQHLRSFWPGIFE